MYKKINKGVYYADETSPLIDINTINFLQNECKTNNICLSRLCLHKDTNSNLMSMLIVVIDQFIYPVHKHSWKDESYTLIKGKAIYEEYNDKGIIIISKEMKEGSSLLNNSRNFHLIRPLSEVIAFIESTTGPFRENKLEFLDQN